MVTHFQKGNVPKYALMSNCSSFTDPKNFKDAFNNTVWLEAMHETLQALDQNNTWVLFHDPRYKMLLAVNGYKTKFKSDGSLERYKAHLIAQGYNQVSGVAFDETSTPVIKPTTIRIVLSIAIINKCCIRQLNVKSAFLNGFLKETAFMEQPPGFVNPKLPNHVWHLKFACMV